MTKTEPMELLLIPLVLGAGVLVLWLLVVVLQSLLTLFAAMVGFIVMIVTGKWLWDFINDDDDEETSAPKK